MDGMGRFRLRTHRVMPPPRGYGSVLVVSKIVDRVELARIQTFAKRSRVSHSLFVEYTGDGSVLCYSLSSELAKSSDDVDKPQPAIREKIESPRPSVERAQDADPFARVKEPRWFVHNMDNVHPFALIKTPYPSFRHFRLLHNAGLKSGVEFCRHLLRVIWILFVFRLLGGAGLWKTNPNRDFFFFFMSH